MKGTFIVLEGGEGSGKSTLARNLEEALSKEGFVVVRTREPGGTPWGEKIRSLLIEKDDTIDHRMAPTTQLLGHYMSRFEHLDRVIVPALREGKVVIADRFELSSYAYQVHAQSDGVLHALFYDLHKHVTEQLRPFRCKYLFCDVHPEIGLSRVNKRGESKTIFDESPLDFHHRVREGMVKGQTCIDPHFHCSTLDASKTAEEVLEEALIVLKQ